jgi:hypothetical protein
MPTSVKPEASIACREQIEAGLVAAANSGVVKDGISERRKFARFARNDLSHAVHPGAWSAEERAYSAFAFRSKDAPRKDSDD